MEDGGGWESRRETDWGQEENAASIVASSILLGGPMRSPLHRIARHDSATNRGRRVEGYDLVGRDAAVRK